MWKALVSIAVVLGTACVAGAETIMAPSEIAAKLRFWSQERPGIENALLSSCCPR
jgi:hypothetical protein